jgi:Fur family ferric uptake transcriptional regulator
MSCEETFLQEIRERGLRMTPQREMVLSVLHDMADHAPAEEIYQRVRLRSAAVDISTVYRTLELLQDMNLLVTVEGADGQRRFALAGGHGAHIHLVCSACGRMFEAGADPAKALAADLRDRHGFILDLGRLSLPGLCRDCGRQQIADG